jgi:hypothetical protein
MMKLGLGAAALAVVASCTRSAAAGAPIALTWDAPPPCPAKAEILAHVRQLTGERL